jgi:hypothetical protein
LLPPAPPPGVTHLTQAHLKSVVAAALAQWAHAGVSAAQLAELAGMTITVADAFGRGSFSAIMRATIRQALTRSVRLPSTR